jgi:uncharacterized glyoxalase superfamily protein PhnB
MFKLAIPLLHVTSAVEAEKFFCQLLGFTREFAHRAVDAQPDPSYIGLSRDGVALHLSSFPGDGVAGAVVNFFVTDVDALYAEFVARQVPIAVAPVNQTWGTREMYVRDADGNSLRFQAAIRVGGE